MHSSCLLFPARRKCRAGLDLLHLGPCSSDLFDDLLNRSAPHERLGVVIPSAHELLDRLLQIRHTRKTAAPYRLVRQFSEPTFYQIQPARARRNEVTDKARMLFKP